MNTIKTYTKRVSFLCAILLFLAVLKLPMEYYRFLRVIVFVGALLIVIKNYKEQLFWVFLFIGIAILFNPVFPIYLYKHSIWMPIDIVVGILFLLDCFLIQKPKEENKSIAPKDIKTYGRDRIY